MENSKPTANPGRRSTVMELASAIPRRRKTHLHGTLETRHASRHPTAIHTRLQSHNREQARSETVDAISQRHATRLSSFQTGCWNSLVEVTQIEPKRYGIPLQCVGRDDVHRSLKQRAISLSSHEAEFHAASACAGELLGLAELFKELHYNVSVHLEMGSDSARHILQRRGPGGHMHIDIRCLAIQQWIREKRLSVGRVDTKDNSADLFTKHLDGPRTQSLARKLGLRILEGMNGDDRELLKNASS